MEAVTKSYAWKCWAYKMWDMKKHPMGMSENGVQTPNEIAIGCRDNDQQNHWVQWGTRHFQTNPYLFMKPTPKKTWSFNQARSNTIRGHSDEFGTSTEAMANQHPICIWLDQS